MRGPWYFLTSFLYLKYKKLTLMMITEHRTFDCGKYHAVTSVVDNCIAYTFSKLKIRITQ